MTNVKYPEIDLELDTTGPEGNAYFILGKVTALLKCVGVTEEDQDNYIREAMSSDYTNLLQVTSKWINLTLSNKKEQ